jgi:hypothetical protein
MEITQIAILKQDWSVQTILKVVKGKKIGILGPDLMAGQPLVLLNLATLGLEAGLGVMIAPQDYIRLTYPDGQATKYFNLFTYESPMFLS